MQHFSHSATSLISSPYRNIALIMALTKREISARYKGSVLGILWSFINPLFMLAVYTFVFSVVFKARWNAGSDSKTEFALVLFAGLMVFNLFAECISRSPTLILSNINYVKKVVFPLEVLPVVVLFSALFNLFICLFVWLFAYCIFFGMPSIYTLWFPLVMLPLALLILGLSWFLASLGVYLRDVSQLTAIFITSLMFMSPIFYPLSSLPNKYQHLLYLNPLTTAIEFTRDVLMWGKPPNIGLLVIYLLVSFLIAWLGFFWFQKTRKGFADVL
jgi:lipopolysaccharide transport system permease protein